MSWGKSRETNAAAMAGEDNAAVKGVAGESGKRAAGAASAEGQRSRRAARVSKGRPASAAAVAGEDVENVAGRGKLFLRAGVWDFLLVLAVSAALAMTVSFSFQSAPDVRGNAAVVAGLCAPMLLILFAGSWSRRAVLPAAVGACAWGAVVLGAAAALTTHAGVPLFVDGGLNDVPESFVAFAAVVIVVPVLVYLLSRRTVGLVFLLLGSVLACAWVQFLYRDWLDAHGLAISVCVYVGLGMLFVYQTYRSSVFSAKRAKRTSFVGVLAYAAGLAAVCVGVAAAVYFGVIAPLNLSTPDLRPFQRYYAVPVVEYSGVFSRTQVEGDETTDQTNDDLKDSDQNAEGGPEQSESEEPQPNPLSQVAQFVSEFSSDSWTSQFNNINYEQLRLGAAIAALAVVALLAAGILARRAQRERRLRAIAGLPTPQQVWWLYDFVAGRFARMKVERAETLTPMEFALTSQRTLAQFSQDAGGVDFVRVTDVYQRTCFGGQQPTEAELGDLKTYYRAFFANARRFSGWKWLWRFWRI